MSEKLIEWREGILRPKKVASSKKKITKTAWELVKYFKPEEFKCPCCGKCDMDATLVFMLDTLREFVDEPLVITSGFRCMKYNEEIGGKKNSAHLKGKAVDIYCVSQIKRYKILMYALLLGFQRIGIGKDFIHLDIDLSLPHPRIWLYPAKKKKKRR